MAQLPKATLALPNTRCLTPHIPTRECLRQLADQSEPCPLFTTSAKLCKGASRDRACKWPAAAP
eukprot:1430350-Alexandrium_andersonii.AAC.1